ncbi:MAG: efflux RND transporter periplasmic adaptor subunit [Rhodothermales bacterium]|nr:efflux RND transporter periplasmic adaptor subunit [Rhodothermales bacterium]
MSTVTSKWFLVGAGIVAVGIVGLFALSAMRPDPPREQRRELAPLVRVAEATRRSGVISVSGSGAVAAVREAQISAEVSGRVTWVSPEFVTGGAFRRGEPMLRIDTTDFALAVRTAEAGVTEARYNLIVAREESEIAREEWASLQARDSTLAAAGDASELGNLVFREPQIRLAESALAAAEARLADANVRLNRTVVRAPFNGRVRAKQAEIGQFLAPGVPVVTLYGTDAVEIPVPLALADAALIEGLFTREAAGGLDIDARVRRTVDGRTVTWPGQVHRVEGALDPSTRTVRVVVRVDDPYVASDGRPPLLVGSFAQVEIDARRLASYVTIPTDGLREAPHDNDGSNATRNIVWRVDGGRIRFQPVEVLKARDEVAIITGGLSPGDRVVTSDLGVVVDSMAIRIEESR